MKKQKGFSLVELLVVLAIIGLLATLAVISLSGIREKGRDTKRLADVDAVVKALELVKSETGNYNSSNSLCGAVPGIVSACTGNDLADYLPTVANVQDPLGTAKCTAASEDACDYGFGTVDSDSYQVFFYLEKGVQSYDEGCYKATEAGISGC